MEASSSSECLAPSRQQESLQITSHQSPSSAEVQGLSRGHRVRSSAYLLVRPWAGTFKICINCLVPVSPSGPDFSFSLLRKCVCGFMSL